MNIKLNDFHTGWYSVELGVSVKEIERLISLLEELKKNSFDHFLIANDSETEKGGIENIEIYLGDEDMDSNSVLLGGDISPK